jgi:transcriptional regulator with XRE-family HTH domain
MSRGTPNSDEEQEPSWIGLRVLELRLKKGMTKSQLAKKAGISRQTLDSFERFRAQGVSFAVLAKLAAALGEHPATLITDVRPEMAELAPATAAERGVVLAKLELIQKQFTDVARLGKQLREERNAVRDHLTALNEVREALESIDDVPDFFRWQNKVKKVLQSKVTTRSTPTRLPVDEAQSSTAPRKRATPPQPPGDRAREVASGKRPRIEKPT